MVSIYRLYKCFVIFKHKYSSYWWCWLFFNSFANCFLYMEVQLSFTYYNLPNSFIIRGFVLLQFCLEVKRTFLNNYVLTKVFISSISVQKLLLIFLVFFKNSPQRSSNTIVLLRKNYLCLLEFGSNRFRCRCIWMTSIRLVKHSTLVDSLIMHECWILSDVFSD